MKNIKDVSLSRIRKFYRTLLFAALLLIMASSAASDSWFEQGSVSLTTYHLFDMGVARINSDQYFDIFTSNHSDNQGIFFGEHDGNFSSNRITQTGLNQDIEFPGLEGRRTSAGQEQEGLYFYWLFGRFYFVSNSTTPIEGYVEFPSTVEELTATGGADAVFDSTLTDGGFLQTRIDIAFDSPGEIEVVPRHVGVPLQINLEPNTSLDNVFIGWRKLQPRHHSFTAMLLDRHGYAWSDVDNNGKTEVYITRGGLHGDIGSYPTSIVNDELLMQIEAGYIDTAGPSGIFKLDGRGRQVAWVDVNNDGRLDLYVNNLLSPNLLFVRDQQGGFTERAASYGLNLTNSGAFLWLDIDSDNDMDMLIKDVGSREINIFRNQSAGEFTEEVLISRAGVALVQWTQADIDRDGDIDVFMASSQGSQVLVNDGLNFSVIDPEAFGLPDSGISAQFVDFDNDSRMDLHLVPGGVYRQRTNGTFYRTQYLRDIFPVRSNRIWNLWFDADIDGDMDLIAAHRLPVTEGSDGNRYNAAYYKNIGASNNWFQLDLIGPEGNASAIGAVVEIIQNNPSKRLVQFVGTAEGSRYSQGHYRLYFGLNKMRTIPGLRIYWPNGEVQVHPRLDVNQLVEIEYNPEFFE